MAAAERQRVTPAPSRPATVPAPAGPPATDATAGEIMVVCLAREIADGELVFVGTRLPLLGFMLAKRTHAPRAVALFENGVLRRGHGQVSLPLRSPSRLDIIRRLCS